VTRADAVIIGGGSSGLCIAYWLTKMGMRDVVLLDKGYLACGATGRCIGGIRAQFANEPDILLALHSERMFERLGAEIGFDPLFRQGGYLFLAFSEEDLEGFRQNSKLHNRLGVHSRMVTPEEMRRIAPGLNTDGIVGGSFHQKDGCAVHFAVTEGLAEKARAQGATLRTFVTVESIETAGGSVTGVETSEGFIATSNVVCAAGIESMDLLKPVGIDLPLRAMKREALVTEPVRPFFDPMIASLHGHAMYQTLRGEVVAEMSEGEEQMDTRSWSTSFSFLEMSARGMLTLMPCMRDVPVQRAWGGTYDMSPDHRPILQAFSSPRGLALAAGYSGHGFMLATMVGKIIAELVIHGRSTFDISTFQLERYTGPELRTETTVI
jgi:sarcosine oxidase subunit beta